MKRYFQESAISNQTGHEINHTSLSAYGLIIAAAIAIGNSASPAQEFLGPIPYLDFDDPAAGEAVSPFAELDFSYFHLEDFEDGSLDVPGVTVPETSTVGLTFAYSDSVDGDDDNIDGLAMQTRSLFSNFQTMSFTFEFSESILGEYPTHAGIVWTDIGTNWGGAPRATDLIDNVTFEAFGPDGESLGEIGPYSLGDSSISSTTDEDRFFGAIHPLGLSAIKISMPGLNNWEVDHLQYGRLAPAPRLAIESITKTDVVELTVATEILNKPLKLRRSTDLSSWTTIATVTPTASPFVVQDPSPPEEDAFYIVSE